MQPTTACRVHREKEGGNEVKKGDRAVRSLLTENFQIFAIVGSAKEIRDCMGSPRLRSKCVSLDTCL